MTRYFYVAPTSGKGEPNRAVTEVKAHEVDEAGEIRLSGDQFKFDIGTGISAMEVTVNDWLGPQPLEARVRAVAAMADAMWAEICG